MEREPTTFFEINNEWYAHLIISEGKYLAIKLDAEYMKGILTKFQLVEDPRAPNHYGQFVLKSKS
jgi:hypothetical protein